MKENKCPICGKNIEGSVCLNCGCVLEEIILDYRPIKSLNRNLKEKRYKNEFLYPFSPNIRHTHKQPQRVKNPDLRRAFKLQRKIERRDEKDHYLKAYLSLKKYCSILNLPTYIMNESINIYKEIVKKDSDFFRQNNYKPSYLAFIQIACKIHEFPLLNSKIVGLIDYKVKREGAIIYMNNKFNKAYMRAKKLLKIRFDIPKHPKYIDYVALTLDLPYKCAVIIHKMFTNIRKYFNFGMKLEAWILALYYIKFKKEYKITLDFLEEMFEVSRITIGNRRTEINKILEARKNTTSKRKI